MEYSAAGGKLIHEKNQMQKISWHCPFKRTLESCMKDFCPGVLEKFGRKPRIYRVNKPDLSVLVSSALLLISEFTQTSKTQRTFQIGLKKCSFSHFCENVCEKVCLFKDVNISRKIFQNLRKFKFSPSFLDKRQNLSETCEAKGPLCGNLWHEFLAEFYKNDGENTYFCEHFR